MQNFRQFEAGPDPFGQKFQILFKWMQTAISTRHADTVDVKFILVDENGGRTGKTIRPAHRSEENTREPHSPRSTLFPYTTLFRSGCRPPSRRATPIPWMSSSSWWMKTAGVPKRPSRCPMPPCLGRAEEHTSELQAIRQAVFRLLL